MNRVALCLAVFLTLPACTWVKPDTLSSQVKLRKAAEVTQCKKKGSASVKTLSRVVLVPRSDRKVEEELQTLAKREAAVMGGNTIVADSLVDKGAQTYGVYLCP